MSRIVVSVIGVSGTGIYGWSLANGLKTGITRNKHHEVRRSSDAYGYWSVIATDVIVVIVFALVATFGLSGLIGKIS